MAFTPVAGAAGRVALGALPAAIAGIKSWKLNKKAEALNVTNFESAADANSVIGSEFISSFIANSTCSIEGVFDASTGAGATSDDLLPIGTQVTLTLLYSKTTALGYHGLTAIVTSTGPSMTLTEAGAFAAEFQITGLTKYPTTT